MPKYVLIVTVHTENDTPENLTRELVNEIERDPQTTVLSVVVVDDDLNELHVFQKGISDGGQDHPER